MGLLTTKNTLLIGVLDFVLIVSMFKSYQSGIDESNIEYIEDFEQTTAIRTVARYPHHYSSPMLRTKSGLLEFDDVVSDYQAIISDTMQRLPSRGGGTMYWQHNYTTMMFHIDHDRQTPLESPFLNNNQTESLLDAFESSLSPASSNDEGSVETLSSSSSPSSSNRNSSDEEHQLEWQDYLTTRPAPRPLPSSSNLPSTSMIFDLGLVDSTDQESEDMDLMYQQDIDLGFHWQHLAPDAATAKSLDQSSAQKQLIVDDYVIDGETGEQEVKPLQNEIEIQGNLPGLLDDSDDFDIDEYLELLEKADFVNFEQPLNGLLNEEKPDEVLQQTTANNSASSSMNVQQQQQNFDDLAAIGAEWNVLESYQDVNFYHPAFAADNQQQQQQQTDFDSQTSSLNQQSSATAATPGSMFDSGIGKIDGYQQQQQQMHSEIFVPVSLDNQSSLFFGNYDGQQQQNSSNNNSFMTNTISAAAGFAPFAVSHPMASSSMQQQAQENFPMGHQHRSTMQGQLVPMETDQSMTTLSATSGPEPGQIFFDLDKDMPSMSSGGSNPSSEVFMDTCLFPNPPSAIDHNHSAAPLPPLTANDEAVDAAIAIDNLTFMQHLKQEDTSYMADTRSAAAASSSSFEFKKEIGSMMSSRVEPPPPLVVVKQEPLSAFDEQQMRDMRNVNHNHTYDGTNGVRKVKKVEPSSSRKSRDERKAQELAIPFTLDQIIFTPVDDFNEMVAQVALTSEQQLLIKDIRRRGKNKIAAQNCRKRKVETINSMEEDVEQLRRKREELLAEQQLLSKQKLQMEHEYSLLRTKVLTTINGNNSGAAPSSSAASSSSSNYFFMNNATARVVHHHHHRDLPSSSSGASTSSANGGGGGVSGSGGSSMPFGGHHVKKEASF